MIPSHCVGCPAASALAAKRRECAGHEKRQDTHSLSTALLPTGPVLLTEGRRPAGAEGRGPPAARSPGRECRRRRRSRIHGRRRVAHGTAVSVRRTRTCRWPRGSWRGRRPGGWLECGAGPLDGRKQLAGAASGTGRTICCQRPFGWLLGTPRLGSAGLKRGVGARLSFRTPPSQPLHR
jgi:hypothetical protein